MLLSYGINRLDTRHRFSARTVAHALKSRAWSRLELCFYALPLNDLSRLPTTTVLHRDQFQDLALYQQWERDQMSRQDFLLESQNRRALGYHLYTLVQDGTLHFYGWLVDRQTRSEDPLMGQVFFPPPDASIIFDCFTHPAVRGRGIYYGALCRMLRDARDLAQARRVYMGAFSDNLPSRHVLEKIGFAHVGSLLKTRRLGLTRRHAVAVSPDFRTALL